MLIKLNFLDSFMDEDSKSQETRESLEGQARKFWYEINSKLPEEKRLGKDEIDYAIQTASDIGFEVMIGRFTGDRSFNWKNVAYNMMNCHPCRTCLMDFFNEDFDAECAKDPITNAERVRKYHEDHIAKVPSGVYSVNRQIFADMGEERALELA